MTQQTQILIVAVLAVSILFPVWGWLRIVGWADRRRIKNVVAHSTSYQRANGAMNGERPCGWYSVIRNT